MSLKGDVVKEALEKFRNGSSLSIAKAIYKNNSELFSGVEDVRSIVRYYRGKRGEKSKKYKEFESPINYYNLPSSVADKYEPFVIPAKFRMGIILADIHIPFHEDRILNVVFDYIKSKKEFDFILLNGDIIDFFSISDWIKDPRQRDLRGEVEALKQFLESLQKNFPEKKIFYKQGNHEERWDKYFYQKAPEMWDLDSIHLDKFLELEKRGIEWIKDKRIVKYHKLYILHGHEYRSSISNPVSASRGIFLKAKDSVFVNHFHQTSENSEMTIGEKIITCYSGGCMCNLHPAYSPLNPKWNYGFAEIRNDDDYYFVSNKRIIDGRII